MLIVSHWLKASLICLTVLTLNFKFFIQTFLSLNVSGSLKRSIRDANKCGFSYLLSQANLTS